MRSKLSKIVAKADEALVYNNPEDFLSLCAEEMIWRMVGDKTVNGKDEIRKWLAIGIENEGNVSSPPKIHITTIIEENDCVVSYGEMELPQNNTNKIKYTYCGIYRFRKDKIIELTSYVIRSEL